MPEVSTPYRTRLGHESNRLNPRPIDGELFVVGRGQDILRSALARCRG